MLIDAGKIDQVLQNLLTNAVSLSFLAIKFFYLIIIIAQFKFTPAKKSVKVVLTSRPLHLGELLPPALVSPTHTLVLLIDY